VTPWTITTLVLAAAFYALALSHEVYDATSPPGLGWHVVLRKIYSVGAFALISYCLSRALAVRAASLLASVATCALALAAYSAAIEIGQAVAGSQEGVAWNAVDVLCGALGGVAGAYAAWFSTPRPTRGPPRH
jgi:hypothetical protein